MDFLVLGPLEVDRDGAHVRIGSRMQRRLLALLLVQGGDAVTRERSTPGGKYAVRAGARLAAAIACDSIPESEN